MDYTVNICDPESEKVAHTGKKSVFLTVETATATFPGPFKVSGKSRKLSAHEDQARITNRAGYTRKSQGSISRSTGRQMSYP